MPESKVVNVLVVEDEFDLREAMVSFLELEGFVTFEAGNLDEAKSIIKQQRLDVLVLDLGLGADDGIDLLKSGVISAATKVIVASARDEIKDRIRGFDFGVDNYLTKPIALEELVSIIQNYSRRNQSLALSVNQGDVWLLDKQAWVLTAPNGQTTKLTVSEMKVVLKMSETIGKPVERAEIIMALGADISTYDVRRLEVLIRRLRKKVEDETQIEIPITTARNIGYAFTESLQVN